VASSLTARDEFLAHYSDYESSALDELRVTGYARLDRAGHVYLDYTGASLYADAQVREHLAVLEREVLGNPHSASPASRDTTTLVERTRRAVLTWFNATGDYTAVFTLNATGALKHVGECYPFGPDTRLVLTADNHNSVNGIREFAVARGAAVEYAGLTFPELRVDEASLARQLESGPKGLFGLPAQSNFSGVQHPLSLVERAERLGWHVLLDAAAFVPTNRLDLHVVRPHFVTVSFYKMFGYPTGVGCLLVRNDVLPMLRRPWFAGGTVNFATVQARKHLLSPGEAGFEDGTLNFLAIPAVEIGLRHLSTVGIDRIHARVQALTGWMLRELVGLRHSNGKAMVRIYGPLTTAARGATVTLNFYDPEGHLVDYRRVEELAGLQHISLRTGCFCNPGAGETAEHITEDDIEAAVALSADMNLPRFLQFVTHRGGKSAGAIRVSLGIASNFADVQHFVDFARTFKDQTRMTVGEATFDIESCRIIRDGS
jgi:molybdenum cofactor sulfurtransferase